MVGVGRRSAANQAGMSCNEFEMLSITRPTRLRLAKTPLLNDFDNGSFVRR
jgi:hypothetical protein